MSPASAAPQSASSAHPAVSATAAPLAPYNGACGAGYGAIDHLDLKWLGTTWLTFNSSTGKNCVVTVRADPGVKVYMGAAVQLAGNSASAVADYGNYTSYAGPVYLNAAGKCIDWYGQIDHAIEEQYHSHCG